MQRKLPPAPEHLSAEAAAWWRQVVEEFDLEAHHLRLLRLACEAWDRAQEARRELLEHGPIYYDRFGQPRKHPAVNVEEGARMAFLRLVRELDLDGEPHPGYRRR